MVLQQDHKIFVAKIKNARKDDEDKRNLNP